MILYSTVISVMKWKESELVNYYLCEYKHFYLVLTCIMTVDCGNVVISLS